MSLGRGGGKSTFIAGIGAAAVDVYGPLVEPGAQTVVVASSFDQGKEAVFDWFLCRACHIEAHRRPLTESELQ